MPKHMLLPLLLAGTDLLAQSPSRCPAVQPIPAFGRERFGQSLFFPESRAFLARTPRKP